jgi:hypothetical protein
VAPLQIGETPSLKGSGFAPPPPPPPENESLVETVFFYHDQGLSEKEIAEKLRLDVDRVRLIIKFKR